MIYIKNNRKKMEEYLAKVIVFIGYSVCQNNVPFQIMYAASELPSRRTLQIVSTMSSEVQTLVNRNIFMTTGIKGIK